jgi:hypothetical protein
MSSDEFASEHLKQDWTQEMLPKLNKVIWKALKSL